MELNSKGGFCEISADEMRDITGGLVITVAIGVATYTITGKMIVGAIAGAYGIGQAAYEIYNAFR